MADLIQQITSDFQKQIDSFEPAASLSDIGTVLEAGDGIAKVDGLTFVRSQELVQFENGVMGIAFNLERDAVGAIIMGDYSGITQGMTVRSTGRIASVPVGDGLIGRVVNGLGEPIDGKGPIHNSGYRPIERIAPGVISRQDVDTPVQTGIKAIDAMIPIGRGQRQLLIGDRQTGKTAIAIDTIINQKGKNLICIYVAIGRRRPPWPAPSASWNAPAPWTTPWWWSPPRTNRQPCSTSLPTPAAPWAKSSWRAAAMRWWSTTTSPSTPGLTARSPCCCAARRDVKLTPVTFSTCTLACWSALRASR